MKRKVLLILTLTFLVLSVFTISAFAQSKAGTAAAPELLIPLGAPQVAMSGAVVSSWGAAGSSGSWPGS